MSAKKGAGDTPLVGVPACIKDIDTTHFHAVQEKYLTALRDAAGTAPLIIPAFGWDVLPLDGLLDMIDGVLLTGSPSNVEPQHYGTTSRDGVKHDPQRDATTLPLIRRAIERAVPLLAICRGIQELNVALGGSLHQHVEELPGRMDHRSPRGRPLDERYAPRHDVALTKGGYLTERLGCNTIMVNSLHGQGIDRLANNLVVEATAEDGTVEAVRVGNAQAFALGLQWHPEFRATENPVSLSLFQAFGDACRERAARRRLNAAA
ncbi:MAG: gamma-glutamyl-gamma-aminobutyrate hydrolase family protein [Rhodospirillales bacterium]